MIERIQENEKEQAKEIAKKIVNAISECNYATINGIVDNMNEWTTEMIQDLIENYKIDNEVIFDSYSTPCTFNPQYSDGSAYEQEKFYFWTNGQGFGYLYDFTSNGDLNDLTLLLDFYYKESEIEVSFNDLHVL